MSSNIRQAYDLMGEPFADPETAPERVSFSLERDGIKVSASVTPAYFDAKVLPIVEDLLNQIASARPDPARRPQAEPEPSPPQTRRKEPPSVRAVVEALGAGSGPELLRAAAVSLAVMHNMPVFSREALFAEADKAVGHWRKSHGKSAHSILSYLLSSGTLVERGDGQLCLDHAEEKSAILALRAARI